MAKGLIRRYCVECNELFLSRNGMKECPHCSNLNNNTQSKWNNEVLDIDKDTIIYGDYEIEEE